MRSLAILPSVWFSLTVARAQDAAPQAFSLTPEVRQGQYVLWHDPGQLQTLDFRYGIGGAEAAPQPPFAFLEDDDTGTTAKVKVRDAAGRNWSVKFGNEAGPEIFCTRMAWALGYYVEPNYLVEAGSLTGGGNVPHARGKVDADGGFRNGRFQLRTKSPEFLKYVDWSWDDNPFLHTPELGGLKILMMLLSNWDNKDSRDSASRGSNTAIYRKGDQLIYFIDDWGGAMGSWGKFFTRSKWDAQDYARQSADFVSLKDGNIRWGYSGQHTTALKRDLRFSDIDWLMRYLGRVSDQQLRDGLTASGASGDTLEVYLRAIRLRIAQLQKIR